MSTRKEIKIHHNTTIPMKDINKIPDKPDIQIDMSNLQDTPDLGNFDSGEDLGRSGDILPPAAGGNKRRPQTTRPYSHEAPLYKTQDGPIKIPSKEELEAKYVYEANSGLQTNPNQFDPNRFIERVYKFCRNREEDLKSSLSKKGKGSLRSYIQKHYESNFSSPRVNLGVDSVYLVVKDFLECDGDLQNSAVLENVLEAAGVVFEEPKIQAPQQPVSPSYQPAPEPILNENDYYELVCSTGVEQSNYKVIEEKIDTTILPLGELVKGLVARKKGDKEKSIDILKTDQFEACKGFGCSKFNLVSSSNMTEAIFNRKAEPAESLMFRVCCSELNKLGCPQSNEYNDDEQVIYDSALEVHKDSIKAHQQILNLRMKKVFRSKE